MISPLLIVVAALLSAGAVAIAARLSRWSATSLAAGAGGTFVAVAAWRLIANLFALNDDFMPAVSVADVGCLIAGALPPALVVSKQWASRSLVIATGALVAFVVNVVIL
ncbi:hypothetical protein SPF06_14795 [Sinomonas sp. JGH33]|uniref:Uncharacterized protein n=1 Tax=Sinomonas terricola TaxID=3110330 RepID=A0ABU5T8E7_9MICC|nr:hypothetical protein [Sinomonas sp. JGH33]MEA5456001.1 hypothetical protein [Sinomonas sp. JGH33]